MNSIKVDKYVEQLCCLSAVIFIEFINNILLL